MICPHCNVNLLRKERPDYRCSKCRARFALDPKTNRLGLHDLRVRRLVDGLTGGGEFVYTTEQFRWACDRKRLRAAGTSAGVGFAVVAVAVSTGLLLVGAAIDAEAFAKTLGAAALLIGIASLVTFWHRIRWIGPGMSQRAFDKDVVERWRSVYQELPPGLVQPAAGAQPPPAPGSAAGIRLVVVCPDDAVRRCLWANAVADRIGVQVTYALVDVPPGVPLAVLHDASPEGVSAAALVRAAQPIDRPIVDLGLRPATVMASGNAVRLRSRRLSKERVAQLASLTEPGGGAALSSAELRWLGRGWWSPLAALKPAQLVMMLERAAQRAETATDPDRRHALEVGFLTWPTSARR